MLNDTTLDDATWLLIKLRTIRKTFHFWETAILIVYQFARAYISYIYFIFTLIFSRYPSRLNSRSCKWFDVSYIRFFAFGMSQRGSSRCKRDDSVHAQVHAGVCNLIWTRPPLCDVCSLLKSASGIYARASLRSSRVSRDHSTRTNAPRGQMFGAI